MISALLVLATGLTTAAAPADGLRFHDYQWTISASSTDPYDNRSSPWTGSTEIFLWYNCSLFDGITRAQMRVEGPAFEWTSTNGFSNSGVPPELDLTITGCPVGPIVAGSLLVTDFGNGVEFCLGEPRIVTDCQLAPMTHLFDVVGFSSTAAPPCELGSGCFVDYVVPNSWGRLKALYGN